jgi:hypothetical protein
VLAAPRTVCRASAGACDPVERCSGLTAACPADAYSPRGTVCRAATGICDVQEICSGLAPACPADRFAPAGTACGRLMTCNGLGMCI